MYKNKLGLFLFFRFLSMLPFYNFTEFIEIGKRLLTIEELMYVSIFATFISIKVAIFKITDLDLAFLLLILLVFLS